MIPIESLKFLAEQARGAGPRILTIPGDMGEYGLVDSSGCVSIKSAKPDPSRNYAADIDTLCRVANLVNSHEDSAGKVEIWYSRDLITAVFDNEDHRTGQCVLELTPSDQMAKLNEWEEAGGARLNQGAFVLLLRTMFADAFPSTFLAAIRGVKISKRAEAEQAIAQGKASISRSVLATMDGTSAIPERLRIWVPVFAQATMSDTAMITVEIDPDPNTEVFGVHVHPGEIEKAFASAEDAIAKKLTAALGDGCTIPVYRGKP